MGACAETPNCVERSEHTQENIKVNDAFFPFFTLVRPSPNPYFSIISRTKYRAIEPPPHFLEEHAKTPPRLVMEVRKGSGFVTRQPLTVTVRLQPSGRVFTSQPSCGRLPRWYSLMWQGYLSIPFDTSLTLSVASPSDPNLGETLLSLDSLHNRYITKWVKIKGPVKPTPAIEIRLWYLTDPVEFWKQGSEELKSAVSQVVSAN